MLKILNLIEKLINWIENRFIDKHPNSEKVVFIKEDSFLRFFFKILFDYLRFVKVFMQKRLLHIVEYIEHYLDKPWTLGRIFFLCFKLITLLTFVWFAFVLICNLLSFFIKSFFFF